MRDTLSMFNKAQNIEIKNSSIRVTTDTSKPTDLDRLISAVARNAILNAGGRADEVRCYPGTREEVIAKVEKWMDGQPSRGSRMLWLSGPAGAGKSAILQTVAERCDEHGRQAANFFFFRGDGTRNHAQPLVATLVYQLRRFYPALDKPLTDCLMTDPLICSASVEEQFKQLISSPIKMLPQSSLIHQPITLIIDGLDECNSVREQEQILEALCTLINMDHSPFLVLVASRAEPHLVMSFNQIGSSVESIFLDETYRPEDDIRHFVTAKFDEIKKDHSLAKTLNEDWPAKSDIDAITTKSSGQFIYAATVMQFIRYSPESPYLSLLAIYEMQPAIGHYPLAQLDALYSYIFSRAHNIQAVKLILGANLFASDAPELVRLLQLIGYKVIDVQSLFANLAAIIKVNISPIFQLDFYHASMPDYLKEKSRSGIHHVDRREIATELSIICLGNFHDSDSFSLALSILRYVENATATLSDSLLNASKRSISQNSSNAFQLDNLNKVNAVPVSYSNSGMRVLLSSLFPPKRGKPVKVKDTNRWTATLWDYLVSTIEKLYFRTDNAMFKLLLQSWVRFAYRNNIDINLGTDLLGPSASRYYKWCCASESVNQIIEG